MTNLDDMSFTSSASAFFHEATDGFFEGNDPARGPWSEDACHAGPVTGLIARALENLVTDKQLFRLAIELHKPVPMAGFKVDASFTKRGRMISTAQANVLDRQGRIIATASSMHAQVLTVGELPSAEIDCPDLSQAQPGEFPIKKAQHGLGFFSHGIQIAYPPGQDSEPGPTTVWMRTLPLLEGETPTPFQRICPLADCGNGISRNLEVDQANFLNPDLTLILHRLPDSEWLASQAKSYWQQTGLGMSEAILFDEQGPVGAALQTLLVQPR